MKAYVEAMDEFEAQIGIDHFTPVKLCSPRPDSVSLEVRRSGSQHMFCDARNVQRSMAEQCGLHPHTMDEAETEMQLPLVCSCNDTYAIMHKVCLCIQSVPASAEFTVLTGTAILLKFAAAGLTSHCSIISVGRRERRGSEDSTSTGYETSK